MTRVNLGIRRVSTFVALAALLTCAVALSRAPIAGAWPAPQASAYGVAKVAAAPSDLRLPVAGEPAVASESSPPSPTASPDPVPAATLTVDAAAVNGPSVAPREASDETAGRPGESPTVVPTLAPATIRDLTVPEW